MGHLQHDRDRWGLYVRDSIVEPAIGPDILQLHPVENPESYGPLFFKGQKGFQVDLLFQRTDKVITFREMKYHQKPVSALVIPEVKRKCALLKVPRGFTIEKALFTVHGVEPSVRQSEYFDHILELKDYV